jgi:site-specific recombinase XerD
MQLGVMATMGQGWLLPSRSKTGLLTSIARNSEQLATTRALTRLVTYSARHTYATYAVRATGNLFASRDQMGYADIKSMTPYQHQPTDELVVAVNRRNADCGVFPAVGHFLVTLTVSQHEIPHEH